MPIYLYECKKCRTQFEEMRSINDPNPPCPKPINDSILCGGETEKLINFQGRVNGNFATKNS